MAAIWKPESARQLSVLLICAAACSVLSSSAAEPTTDAEIDQLLQTPVGADAPPPIAPQLIPLRAPLQVPHDSAATEDTRGPSEKRDKSAEKKNKDKEVKSAKAPHTIPWRAPHKETKIAGDASQVRDANTAPGRSVNLDAVQTAAPNVHQVAANIYRGGQPDADGLAKLKAAGITTIVNLRNEEVLVAQEARQAKSLGLRFVNIPMDVFNEPSPAAVNQFISILDGAGSSPVFVHCLHGQDRTGAMVALYRIRRQGWSGDQAYSEMLACGFRPGFSTLAQTVFSNAAKVGRPGTQPQGAAILQDVKKRLLHL